MGNGRFIYNNRFRPAWAGWGWPASVTASSLRAGVVTSCLKSGTGSAVLNASGAFSGVADVEYIVEIDSIGAGAEVGQATFRWASSDVKGSWVASGVTTSASNILLNNAVYVNWTTGSGADFVVGDKWYFKGINSFSPNNMMNLDRDSRYRSDSGPSPTLTIDLGIASEITTLVIGDHNFGSGATVLLEADAAATFDSGGGGAPQFSESVTCAAINTVHYLSVATTKRYWRLTLPSVYFSYDEIGEIFLGPYLELSRNYLEGYAEDGSFLMGMNRTLFGVGKDRFYNIQRPFSLEYSGLVAADIAAMKTLLDTICDRSAGTFRPFYFNLDSDTPNDVYMVALESLPIKHLTADLYNISLVLREVLTSV